MFVEKVRDIAGLDMDPPLMTMVLCADEKSKIQVPNQTQPLPPLAPGIAEQHPHDYERHGTTMTFSPLDIGTGTVHHRHRSS